MKISFGKNKITALIIAIFMILIDFISKQLILYYAPKNGTFTLIPFLFNYKFVLNDGAAFGILDNARWIFMIATIVFLIAITIYFVFEKTENFVLLSSIMLIFAGGIGNMIDRLTTGEVVDFLTFGFMSFPSFNIADCCVCIGCALLLIYLLIIEPKLKNKGELNE